MSSGPGSITDNMLCRLLTGATASSLLRLRLSYHSAPELVSRLAAAPPCHLSRTIRTDLITRPGGRQAQTRVCAHCDSDRRTNVHAVTLLAGSLHLRSSEARFKWHREVALQGAKRHPSDGMKKDARTARLNATFFSLLSPRN